MVAYGARPCSTFSRRRPPPRCRASSATRSRCGRSWAPPRSCSWGSWRPASTSGVERHGRLTLADDERRRHRQQVELVGAGEAPEYGDDVALVLARGHGDLQMDGAVIVRVRIDDQGVVPTVRKHVAMLSRT